MTLPKRCTIFIKPIDIIETTKRFYEAKGLNFREIDHPDATHDILVSFDKPSGGPAGFVHLDLGHGFAMDQNKQELWVTTKFY